MSSSSLNSLSEVKVPTTKVLIVDDSDIDRSTYARYLQSEAEHSYQITEVETLEESLERWRAERPDIVLLDLRLPDGDGLEFLAALSEEYTGQRLPVIILTGQGDEMTAVQALKLGAADYLQKKDVTPISLSISINLVRDRVALNAELAEANKQKEILYQSLENRTNELERLSERLALSLKSGSIGSWEWNIIDNTSLWDDRMYELYAVTKQSDHVFNVYDLWLSTVHPDDRLSAETSLREALTEMKTYESDFRIVHPDQSIHFIRCYGTILQNSQGVAERMIGVSFDISDRKQIEEQLLRTNHELLHATKLKDEFLANMSHELRTPLTAVLGMSELLSKQLLGEVNERQQRALSAINKGGQHLLELINDILDLSKISSGKVDLDLASVSVQIVCDSSLVYVKQQAFQKDIKIYRHIAPTISTIFVDERRIRQVLINLLINAVKFTPNKGQVSLLVSVGCGEIWEGEAKVPNQFKEQNLPMILFQVKDTGIGIANKDLCRLFQPFVQIDGGLDRQYEGTGLGLALVKQIAELHFGQVAVESVVGEGSHFTVALPYEIDESSLQSSPDLLTTSLSPKTPLSKSASTSLILLVEDNEANIQIFTAYLDTYDYHLIFAKNGEEAVAMAKAHQPDIILMDIQMPVMDGLEATRLIRADEKLATVPIIALTARAMQGDGELCLAVGATEYISKPVDLERLGEVICQLLNKQNPQP